MLRRAAAPAPRAPTRAVCSAPRPAQVVRLPQRRAFATNGAASHLALAAPDALAAPANLKYTKSHEWIKVEGSNATVGITDYAQKALGDVVFVDLPATGKKVNAGGTELA